MPDLSSSSGPAASRPSDDVASDDLTSHDSVSDAPFSQDEIQDEAGDAPSTLGAIREPQRLHPMTLLLRMLGSLPAVLLLLFPILSNPSSENVFSLVMVVAFGVLGVPAIVLRYYRFSYRITPKQIIIQQGVLNRKNRSIPIERVQNVQIEQNLIARAVGIAKVKIETAGSSGTDGTLEYVGLDQAHKLRQTVRTFQRRQDGDVDVAAEGDVAPEPDQEDLFRLTLPRTLLSGAFRFSLLYLAVIFSAFQFFEPDTVVNWFMQERGTIEGLADSAAAHPALVAFGTILLAVLLGWGSGILLHLNRYYGFHLWLEEGKLRKRHGLFTVTEGTIPLPKVQALILKTNVLMRFFGWYELEVQTIGLDVNEQGHRVLVPFAQRDDILRLAQRVRPFSLPDTFDRVSPLTIRRRFVRRTFALSVLVAGGVYFWPADWMHPMDVALPWWLLTLMPFILLGAYLEYRHHLYRVGDDGFYVRRGVLSRSLWILPTEKFHVFYTTASVFQRRLGLKTLFVDTAGASERAYPDVVDVPADAARTCVGALEDGFFSLYARRIRALGSTGPVVDATDRLRAEGDVTLSDAISIELPRNDS